MSFFDSASLVTIPSGVKDGVLYSVKPIDGSGDLTFSRGSDIEATRVNANGYIEKAQVNLSKNSQTGANWTASGATIDSTSVADFLGGTDAVTYTAVGGSAAYVFSDNTISVPSGGVFTGSLYVKNVDANYVQLTFSTAGFGSAQYRNFDLTNGSLGGGLGIDGKIEDVGSGWYRISLTASATSSSTVASIIAVIVPSASASRLQAATAGQTLTAFGFQFNYGLVAQTYQETTTAAVVSGITDNMPRLSYDPANPTCPHLILEPSRLNKVKHSEFFDGWNNKSNCAFTSNYTVSPEGVQNASRLLFSSNGFTYDQSSQQSNATEYTLSCYAKRNDAGTQNVGFFVNGSGAVNSVWSLTSEWQRFTYTYTSTNTAYAGIAGIAGADISVYGFQMEAASYASSLIPTYGSSATRNNETTELLDMKANGITTTGAWSAFFDISQEQEGATDLDNSSFFYTYVNNLANAIISARKYYTSNPEGFVRWYSNIDAAQIGYSGTTNKKWAVVCNGTNVRIFTDGARVFNYTGTNSHNSLGSMQVLYGTSDRTTTSWSQVLVFPTAISDADAIALTA